MSTESRDHRSHRFLIGVAVGTFVGTGLAILLAPRAAAELRERLTSSAKALKARAAKRCEEAGASVGDAVDELAKKGRELRDNVADAVAHGAHEVERVAKAARAH